MKKIALAIALLAISASSAMAGEVYGQLGTEGYGLGYSHRLTDTFGVRAEFNHFSKSYTQSGSDADYRGNVTLGGVSLLSDYFPLQSNLRITAGLVANNTKVDGTAVSTGGTYTVNGHSYVYAGGDSAKATLKFGDTTPYLGIGYGHNNTAPGLHFFADVGVIFMKPNVDLTLTGTLATSVTKADLDAERSRLQNDADKFSTYPVVKFGVAYSF